MKSLLVSALLLGFCAFALSDLCTKGRRVFRVFPKLRNPPVNVSQYYVMKILPAEINSTFTLKIDNAFADGETTITFLGSEGAKANVTEVDKEEGVFSLVLTDLGKEALKERISKSRRRKPSLVIPIGIAFTKKVDPKDSNAPRFAEFTVGDFSCSGPKCGLTDPCSLFFESKSTTDDAEEGTADLPITTSRVFQLKVGFDTPIAALELTGRLHYKDNECGQIWRYTDRQEGTGTRVKPRDLKLKKYLIRVASLAAIPPVSYIEYEDRICKTTCGTKPVCPGEPTEPTEELDEPTEPTEELIDPEAPIDPEERDAGTDNAVRETDEERIWDDLEDVFDDFVNTFHNH